MGNEAKAVTQIHLDEIQEGLDAIISEYSTLNDHLEGKLESLIGHEDKAVRGLPDVEEGRLGQIKHQLRRLGNENYALGSSLERLDTIV